ncbi:MAG: Phosphoglucomutase [Firmicutes bacterium ADurb.Bin506]|nr:MAG: Phosphoglucomutase [Firmicutes bacterium ADurb.Bin506]
MSWSGEFERWRTHDGLAPEHLAELERIAERPEEIADRFGSQLAFGTGGLRGKLGLGTSRMNRFTVRRATMGYASYLLDRGGGPGGTGVVIAYDSRTGSEEFAEEAALVLASRGIPVHVFHGIRPTPLLSYAVRTLGAQGGIVITASHNPPEYNGYKVYGPNGGQLLPDEANEIGRRAAAVDNYFNPPGDLVAPVSRVGQEMDERYLRDVETVVERSLGVRVARESRARLGIVFTPLHGTGYRLVPAILETLGFADVSPVEEQCVPDGTFPTVKSPNPEDPGAFDLAMVVAEEMASKGRRPALLIATDPDADRLGACVWDGQGYRHLTGNQIGVLLADALIEARAASGVDMSDCVLMKSIVSTEMVRSLCDSHGIRVIDTLTGFKYIGAKMDELDDVSRQFVLGFEESCGYLAGDLARDKDAVMAAALLACAAASSAASGGSLWLRLQELYARHGYYFDRLITVPVSQGNGPGRAMQGLPAAGVGHRSPGFGRWQ